MIGFEFRVLSFGTTVRQRVTVKVTPTSVHM